MDNQRTVSGQAHAKWGRRREGEKQRKRVRRTRVHENALIENDSTHFQFDGI